MAYAIVNFNRLKNDVESLLEGCWQMGLPYESLSPSAWSLWPKGGEGTVTFSPNILHNYTCSDLTLLFQSLGLPRAAGRDPFQSQLCREFLLLSVVPACLKGHCPEFSPPISCHPIRARCHLHHCPSDPNGLSRPEWHMWWKRRASLECDFKGLEVSFPGFSTLGCSSGMFHSREPQETLRYRQVKENTLRDR